MVLKGSDEAPRGKSSIKGRSATDLAVTLILLHFCVITTIVLLSITGVRHCENHEAARK